MHKKVIDQRSLMQSHRALAEDFHAKTFFDRADVELYLLLRKIQTLSSQCQSCHKANNSFLHRYSFCCTKLPHYSRCLFSSATARNSPPPRKSPPQKQKSSSSQTCSTGNTILPFPLCPHPAGLTKDVPIDSPIRVQRNAYHQSIAKAISTKARAYAWIDASASSLRSI